MAKKNEQPAPAGDHDEHLVRMHKDGETLDVHPSCVKAHADAGWQK